MSDVISLIKKSTDKLKNSPTGSGRRLTGGSFLAQTDENATNQRTAISPKNHNQFSTHSSLEINTDLFSAMDEDEFENIERNVQWGGRDVRMGPLATELKRDSWNKESLRRDSANSPRGASSVSGGSITPTNRRVASSQSPSLHQSLASVYSPYSARIPRDSTFNASLASSVSPNSSGAQHNDNTSPSASFISTSSPHNLNSLTSTLHQNEALLQNSEKYAQKLNRTDELKYLRKYNEKLKEDMLNLKERHKRELHLMRQQLQTEKENFLREQNLLIQEKIQTKFEELKVNHEEVLLSQMNEKFVQNIKSERALRQENKSLSSRINNLTRDLKELRTEHRTLSVTNQKLEKDTLLNQSREKELQTKIHFLKSRLSALQTSSSTADELFVTQPRMRHTGVQATFPQAAHTDNPNESLRAFTLDSESFTHFESRTNAAITIDESLVTMQPKDADSSFHVASASIETLENIRADVSIELDDFSNKYDETQREDDNSHSDAIRNMEQLLSAHPSLMSGTEKENDTLTLSEVASEENDLSQVDSDKNDSTLTHKSVVISSDEDESTNYSVDLALNEDESLPDSFEISRLRKRKRKILGQIDNRDKALKRGMRNFSQEMEVISALLPDLVQYITDLMRSHKNMTEKNSILEEIVARTEEENQSLHNHVHDMLRMLNEAVEQKNTLMRQSLEPDTRNSEHSQSTDVQQQNNADQKALMDELELLRDAYDNFHGDQEVVLRDCQDMYEEKLKKVEEQIAAYRSKYGELDANTTPVLQIHLSSESEASKRKPLASPKSISNVPRLFRHYKRTDRLLSPNSLIRKGSEQKFEFVCLQTEQIIVQCGYFWTALSKLTKGRYQFSGTLPIYGSGVTVHARREINASLPPGLLSSPKSSHDSVVSQKAHPAFEKILYFGDKSLFFFPGAFALRLRIREAPAENPFNYSEKGLAIFSMTCLKKSPPMIPQLLDASTKLEVDQKCFVESALGHPTHENHVTYHFSILLSSSLSFQLCLYSQLRRNDKLEMLCRFPILSPKNVGVLRTQFPKIHAPWTNLKHKRLFSPRKHSLAIGELHHFHLELDSCESVDLCFISVDNDENWIEMNKTAVSVMEIDVAEWECDFETTVRGVLSVLYKRTDWEGAFQKALEFVME